ncbi:O-antigen ligase family protein [Chryseobacterium sp. SNU WT5]|uniref:O-antigen ligase family protein n=1 Tax=Chryseobacterium sp. SNU WT5 TaxID=2594269 RepID=UPI0016239646|nr:O-antigen ligase family protein [Chryseobacterium sp. SNU WT5]
MEIIKKLPLEVWFLLLIVTGYTIFSALAVPFNIENSQIFSVPFRVIVFLLSLYIIGKNFTFKKGKNIAVLAVIFFWLLYSLKSYLSFTNDFYENPFAQNYMDVYVRIFVIAFVPSLALLFINYKEINFSQVAKGFFYTLVVMLTVNMIYGVLMPAGKSLQFIFSMYYISYGHLGTSLVLISLFYFLFRSKEIPSYLLIYGMMLGISTIVIAGARSPFLAIMVAVPYLLVIKKNYKLISIFILLLLLSIIGIYFLGRNENFELMFVDRTYLWLFEGDNSLRTPLFKNALNIFKQNPILGGRTHFENGMYPHNIFLELLMATGIVGLIIYMLKFIPVIKNFKIFSYQIINSYHILFFTLFLQYFVLCFTSFTLYSVPEFLYFSSIIIGISLNNINEENESNDGRRNPSGDY